MAQNLFPFFSLSDSRRLPIEEELWNGYTTDRNIVDEGEEE